MIIKRTGMPHFSAVLLAVAILCAVLPDATRRADASSSPLKTAVTSIPVTTLDGRGLDIARQPGWRVVYFWSAECPCVKACENYTLRPMAEKYAGKVTFYAVVAGGYDLAKPVANLRSEFAARHLPYDLVLDRSHQAVKALDADVTPETFLIDPENHVLFSGMPDDSRRFLDQTGKHGVTVTYLSRAMAQALADKPVTTPHTEGLGCIIAW